MKTITELEKEIEEKKEELHIDIPEEEGLYSSLNELKAKLQTLQEVCEEMKKVFKREIELQTVGTDTIDKIEELLKKFQGESK